MSGCGTGIVLTIPTEDGGTRTVEITSSDGSINIVKTVLATKDIYDLSVAVIYALVGGMTLTPSVVQLLGDSISVTVDWTWTKNSSPASVNSQDFDDGVSGYQPIVAALRQEIVSSVVGTRTFRIRGTDGVSTITVSKTLTFANYIYYGEMAEDLDGSSEANIVTKIKTLGTLLQADVETQFTGSGTALDPKYYYFAFPASMDPSDYFEDPSKTTQAGFFQLGDSIRSGFFLIGQYDITNDADTPYTEEYKIYQSASNYLDNITYNVKQV